MDLGDQLLKQLEVVGMSQAELANRLGVQRQAVTNWVKGHSRPSRDNLVRLEDILGVPRGELMRLLGYSASSDREQRLVTLEEAIRAEEDLSAEHKRALLVFVKAAREEAAARREPKAQPTPASDTTAPVRAR